MQFFFLVQEETAEDSISEQRPRISLPSTSFARESMNALVVRKQQNEASAQTEAERSFSLPATPPLLRSAQKRNRRRTVVGTDREIEAQRNQNADPFSHDSCSDLVSDDATEDEEAVTSRCRACWLTATRVATSHAGLFVILVIYTVFGGALFQAIEGPHETEQRSDLQRARDDVITAAWQLAQNFTHFDNFSLHLSQVLDSYEVTTRRAFEHGITAGDDMRIWDYWGSFFFSTTVYSTVGKG